jgi:hypothetical protein
MCAHQVHNYFLMIQFFHDFVLDVFLYLDPLIDLIEGVGEGLISLLDELRMAGEEDRDKDR